LSGISLAIAFCIHDFADFSYIRFHGPTSAKYWGSYSDGALRKWAERIDSWRRDLSAVYVYFNNDPEGAAVRNALTLKSPVCRKKAQKAQK